MKVVTKICIIVLTIGSKTTDGMARVTNTKASQTLGTETIKKIWSPSTIQNKVAAYLSKSYKYFEHPLYTKFFEPLYVGNKADLWGDQIFDFYQNPMKTILNYKNTIKKIPESIINFHIKMLHNLFHTTNYQIWKNKLTPEEQTQYFQEINEYENAYDYYMLNHTDPYLHAQLLHHLQKLYTLDTHLPLSQAMHSIYDKQKGLLLKTDPSLKH